MNKPCFIINGGKDLIFNNPFPSNGQGRHAAVRTKIIVKRARRQIRIEIIVIEVVTGVGMGRKEK